MSVSCTKAVEEEDPEFSVTLGFRMSFRPVQVNRAPCLEGGGHRKTAVRRKSPKMRVWVPELLRELILLAVL